MTETWKPVVGYDGAYEVSPLGVVRSRRQVLKPQPAPNGYLTVNLSLAGRSKRQCIHTLVALAFLGPRPTGRQIAHLDGVKANNAATNLAYVTASDNCLQRRDHGTQRLGVQHHRARLDPETVAMLRATVIPFQGPVSYVGDGDGLCIALGPDPSRWVEVRLADFYAPELREPGGRQAKATLDRLTAGRDAL